MSAILKFLTAARSLANQGLSKEAIEQFAKNEFGEISELFQKQINNIFKPGKGITSIKMKDPDFDDTVIKLPVDDTGKPFNPKDPLKDYSKKPKKANGGRIGYKDGPKLSDFVDVQASGSKSGKQQIEGAPEGITMDNESINAIIKADIPVSQKIDLLAKYQYGKGRTRIERDDSEIFLDEGGFKSRKIGFGFNKDGEGIGGTLMYNMETGDPEFNIGFKKSFADGGRIGLKAGMSKRAFLKLMGGAGAGLAALKTGALKLLGKEAAPVATEVVKSAGSTAPPPYFFKLMEKIKFMGEKRKTPSYKERVNEYTYKGKDGSDYELVEDLDTGDIQITKDKTGVGTYGDKSFDTIEDRTEMVFKKGKADETTKGKKPPDEYEEYKVEFDQDGTAADATDIDDFSKRELIEEAGDTSSLTLKRAGGGVAYMLGQ